MQAEAALDKSVDLDRFTDMEMTEIIYELVKLVAEPWQVLCCK